MKFFKRYLFLITLAILAIVSVTCNKNVPTEQICLEQTSSSIPDQTLGSSSTVTPSRTSTGTVPVLASPDERAVDTEPAPPVPSIKTGTPSKPPVASETALSISDDVTITPIKVPTGTLLPGFVPTETWFIRYKTATSTFTPRPTRTSTPSRTRRPTSTQTLTPSLTPRFTLTATPISAGIYDDNESDTIYTGDWFLENPEDAVEQTTHYSLVAGEEVKLSFIGQRITLLYGLDPEYGVLAIEIDGELVFELDQFADTTAWQLQWVSDVLDPGEHTIRLINLDDRLVNVDAFVIWESPDLSPIPTLTPTFEP